MDIEFKKILVVDDARLVHRMVANELFDCDYELFNAFSAEEGLDILKSEPNIELIILDLCMPGMSGFEFLHERRNSEGSLGDIPVILLTSNDSEKDQNKAFNLGVSDIIIKPFTGGELVQTCKEILNPHHIYQDLNVLLIEESNMVKNIMLSILQTTGVKTLTASDPRKAKKVKEEQQVDLIISEHYFGDTDLEQLIIDAEDGEIPFIIIGNRIDESRVIELYKKGISDYILKPFVKDELLVRLEVHFKRVMIQTNYKNAIAELKRITKDKDELSDAMVEAYEKVKDADESKSEFLANMSHEIRSPMNGVLGMANLLLNTDLNTTQHKYAEAIQYSAKSLLTIINDILDFSKIEAGKLDISPHPFDLKKLLKMVHESFLFQIKDDEQKKLVLNFDNSLQYVLGDETRVKQILNNLISNAVKFTKEGEIDIKVENQASGDRAKVQFIVSDTGIGMTAAQLAKVFNKFTQAEKSTSREFGGTGLGLSISKHLAQLMGGDITASSEAGKGSTFTLELTFEPVESLDEPEVFIPKFDSDIDISALSILLVEDNQINQLVAKTVIEDMGHSVDIAEDGRIAVDKACQNTYDLIFMDCQMPVMDGITATKLIRKTAPEMQVPIVAMTADAMEENKQLCLEAGMNDFISKPIAFSAVQDMINKYIVQSKVMAH